MYPIGVIVMWFWPKWKKWVKALVTIPGCLLFFVILLPILIIALNPAAQVKQASCVKQCTDSVTNKLDTECTTRCIENSRNSVQPTVTEEFENQ